MPAFHKYRVRLDATKLGVDAPPATVRDAVLRALRAEGVRGGALADAAGARARRCSSGWMPSRGAGRRQLRPRAVSRRRGDSSTARCVLFSQTYPIAPQPRALVEAYAEAFARVWTRLPEVLAR